MTNRSDQCASRVLVLVFSASANASPRIRREVARALHKGVVALRIEDIVPIHALEDFIATVHWFDASTPLVENHLRRLTATVTKNGLF